jgi:hypothetical protein
MERQTEHGAKAQTFETGAGDDGYRKSIHRQGEGYSKDGNQTHWLFRCRSLTFVVTGSKLNPEYKQLSSGTKPNLVK